jgi:ADP-ribose pyrophosphatase YjhB (NUDIX family)
MKTEFYCAACGTRLPHLPPVTCPSCGTGHWQDAKPCASGLVTHDSRLLMVQRAHEPWRGCWDVPGGFCEAEEHPIRTAEREVLEETGLIVRVTGFLGMWMDEYGTGVGRLPKTTLNIYYHAIPVEGIGIERDPAEVAAVRWFSADELPADLAFPRHIAPVLASWRASFLAGHTVTPLLDRPA